MVANTLAPKAQDIEQKHSQFLNNYIAEVCSKNPKMISTSFLSKLLVCLISLNVLFPPATAARTFISLTSNFMKALKNGYFKT